MMSVVLWEEVQCTVSGDQVKRIWWVWLREANVPSFSVNRALETEFLCCHSVVMVVIGVLLVSDFHR